MTTNYLHKKITVYLLKVISVPGFQKFYFRSSKRVSCEPEIFFKR
jgi:uncharacterized membrane protein YobD (UPF0266 family)